MFGPSLMNQNKFSLEVASAEYYFLQVGIFCKASRRIFFWSIVCNDCKNTVISHVGTFSDESIWSFLPDITLCDASKRLFFWTNCKITVFYLMEHCVMHQNEFSFEVLYAVIARILFSTCWNLLWWIKTNLVLRWQMQWLQEYYYLHVGTCCDGSKQILF